MTKEEQGITRRQFGRLLAGAAAAAAALLGACTAPLKPRPEISCDGDGAPGSGEYDYIVVGSGAGGGPLAANLARRGHRVLLLDAGGDEEGDNYRIPLFHPFASEDPAMRWDFFVRHYADEGRSRADCKFVSTRDGVYYPRCSTLGGCTAHNAMILVYPHDSDWDDIARLTGDESWSAERMRRYFERMENCQYLPETSANPERRGFRGWLPTSLPPADTVLGVILDRQLRDTLLRTVALAFREKIGDPLELLRSGFDPNNWRSAKFRTEGLYKMPLTTYGGRRAGPREYIRQVEKSCGGRLTVKLHTLVTRVILAEEAPGGSARHPHTAVGVEVVQGRRLYRADREPQQPAAGRKGVFRARREVILAGGAFNTPQLLMLSGIGPARHLQEMGIAVAVDLPGVGENLQDRYEVGVVTEMKQDFAMLRDLSFAIPKPGEPPNPHYQEWLEGKGIFATNGAVVSFIKKSSPSLDNPDLFIFGMPGYFAGYYPGYSKQVAQDQRHFTWAILKAHTKNTGGVVRLKSRDPQEPPYVNFHYFEEGSDRQGEDLQALVDGVRFVRSLIDQGRLREHIAREVVPGAQVQGDRELAEFARANAWGHHASCSCRMGAADDPKAVLDSRFRVCGVNGLRVVDASVFPHIPGFFIVSAIYMISEKAADVIHEDANGNSTAV